MIKLIKILRNKEVFEFDKNILINNIKFFKPMLRKEIFKKQLEYNLEKYAEYFKMNLQPNFNTNQSKISRFCDFIDTSKISKNSQKCNNLKIKEIQHTLKSLTILMNLNISKYFNNFVLQDFEKYLTKIYNNYKFTNSIRKQVIKFIISFGNDECLNILIKLKNIYKKNKELKFYKENRSLNENKIEIIQKYNCKFEKNYDYIVNNNCSICMEELNNTNKLTVLNCNHVFHTKCLISWFKQNFVSNEFICPNCRSVN